MENFWQRKNISYDKNITFYSDVLLIVTLFTTFKYVTFTKTHIKDKIKHELVEEYASSGMYLDDLRFLKFLITGDDQNLRSWTTSLWKLVILLNNHSQYPFDYR